MVENIFGIKLSWTLVAIGLFILVSTPMVDGAPSQAPY